jgi:hypothetical protein
MVDHTLLTDTPKLSNALDSLETIETAMAARLSDFDINSDKYPAPVAGRMRRSLRRELRRLAQLKQEINHERKI